MQPGNIYGLLGKNGAGKSTLLKNIAGLLKPQSGSISVLGEIPYHRHPGFLQKIYMISEEVYTPPISIIRYLDLFAPFYPSFNRQEFDDYMKIFEVETSGHLRKLSLGQRKKFIIAFALACNTDLLILDEPTNGLDIPSKTQFRRLISAAMNNQRIVVISTHQTRDLENLIDAVMVVNNGTLLLSASMGEISDRLTFHLVSEVPDSDEILFAEPTIGGYAVVAKNTSGTDTRVNLEYLFYTATENPSAIATMFKNQQLV